MGRRGIKTQRPMVMPIPAPHVEATEQQTEGKVVANRIFKGDVTSTVNPTEGVATATGAGGTLVKSGPGYLEKVTAMGNGFTLTVYDNTSATGRIMVPNNWIGGTPSVGDYYNFGQNFTLGCYVVIGGTTCGHVTDCQ